MPLSPTIAWHPFSHVGACPSVPEGVAEMITNLRRRIGDEQKFGISDSNLRVLMEHAAGAVNAARGAELREVVLATTAGEAFYSLDTLVPDLVRLVTVRDGSRDLMREPWQTTLYGEPDALKRRGSRFESWDTVGRNVLLLWPPRSEDGEVRLVYAYKPTFVDCAHFENEAQGASMNVAEMLALVRQRNVGGLSKFIRSQQ